MGITRDKSTKIVVRVPLLVFPLNYPFGGIKQYKCMVNFPGFPLQIVHEVWVGNDSMTPCILGPKTSDEWD